MSRAIVRGLGIALVSAGVFGGHVLGVQGAGPAPAALQAVGSQSTPAPTMLPGAASQGTLLQKYCVTCHNDRLRTAGLTLQGRDLSHVGGDAEVWEKVVRKLRTRTMPPPRAPRPDQATYHAMASWLETGLDTAAAAQPTPGRPPIHRLNRVEFANAVRDLLGVEVDGRSLLPPDGSGYGFDNIGDVLSVSPQLFERYMVAARKISRRAIGDPTIPPTIDTYRLTQRWDQHDRMSEDLPFGSRGGMAIRRYFPFDGEYLLRIRLMRLGGIEVGDLDREEQLEVRLDGARVTMFTIGGTEEAAGGKGAAESKTAADQADSTDDNDPLDKLQVRFHVKAGTHLVGVSFVRRSSAVTEGVAERRLPVAVAHALVHKQTWEIAVESVQIGPVRTVGVGAADIPSRRAIFVCQPTGSADEESCATTILSRLARRAYRRPVTKEDVQPLLDLYEVGRQQGGFEVGIGRGIERLLVSPEFLFRIAYDPANVAPGRAYRISDLELASRLSFFLWSSIPDDELLDVAERGQLKEPKVLEQQVRRMLGDARATALMRNFGGQWLLLRNLRVVEPDANLFPMFDENLRTAFQRETEMFLESVAREDRSVIDLVAANYTFLNQQLAEYYGIPHVYGSHFRRVTLSDGRRGGLLGHGSILTVTSVPTRTSPVTRGKWVLDTLLGAPPPAPPPDVPLLTEGPTKDGTLLSVRERMEQHRKHPACASCHVSMDPLGFALENFDAVGMWRTSEASRPIDASGTLPDGTTFEGPAGLRQALVAERDNFAYALTEKLLTYALGRGVEYYDAPAVRKIVREALPSEYRWSSLVLGISRSTPFRYRMAPTADVTP